MALSWPRLKVAGTAAVQRTRTLLTFFIRQVRNSCTEDEDIIDLCHQTGEKQLYRGWGHYWPLSSDRWETAAVQRTRILLTFFIRQVRNSCTEDEDIIDLCHQTGEKQLYRGRGHYRPLSSDRWETAVQRMRTLLTSVIRQVSVQQLYRGRRYYWPLSSDRWVYSSCTEEEDIIDLCY
jgi:hypothetical protein